MFKPYPFTLECKKMMLFIRLNFVLLVCLFAHFQLRAQETDYVPNEFLVQFNPETSAINWFNSLALEKKASGISNVKILSELLNIYQLNINPSLILFLKPKLFLYFYFAFLYHLTLIYSLIFT